MGPGSDPVIWHCFGVSHVPRPEDFPVMPVESVSWQLKAFGTKPPQPLKPPPCPCPAPPCGPLPVRRAHRWFLQSMQFFSGMHVGKATCRPLSMPRRFPSCLLSMRARGICVWRTFPAVLYTAWRQDVSWHLRDGQIILMLVRIEAVDKW